MWCVHRTAACSHAVPCVHASMRVRAPGMRGSPHSVRTTAGHALQGATRPHTLTCTHTHSRAGGRAVHPRVRPGVAAPCGCVCPPAPLRAGAGCRRAADHPVHAPTVAGGGMPLPCTNSDINMLGFVDRGQALPGGLLFADLRISGLTAAALHASTLPPPPQGTLLRPCQVTSALRSVLRTQGSSIHALAPAPRRPGRCWWWAACRGRRR